jgi:hypothetical protein
MEDSTVTRTAAQAPPSGTPPQAPPGTGTSTPAPKKKRRGCLVAIVVALAIVALAVAGILLALGRASNADDIGVAYSEADFDSAIAKLGVTWPELPEGADPDDYERVYTGSKPMDVTLSEAELSALMSFRHASSYWPIKSMQIDLTGGGATASAVVTYAGRDWPVFASGSGGVSGSRLDVSIASAEVAGFSVPADYLPMGESFLEGLVNARLERIPGFSVETLDITDEGVHAVGTIWETAEYVKVP